VKGIECAFVGRLGKDAELRTSSAGREWMLLSVIVGEQPDEQWVNVSSWSTTIAELAKTLLQGAQVYAEGRLKLRHWTAHDGTPRTGLSVSASLIQPLALIGNRKPKRPRAQKGAKPGEVSDAFHKPQDFYSDPLPF